MVASPHYLATGAGLHVLRQGGNSIDAAIATNAVLAVVTPYVCGIGGDLFAQVYAGGTLTGLNGSGRSAATASLERVRALTGGKPIPARGSGLAVTVPGCVDAWGQLHARYGRLPLSAILADAIHYAEDGFPVTAAFAAAMRLAATFFHPAGPAAETFLPGGEPPQEGQIVRQPRLAHTLRAIAEEGAEVYYHGWIAGEIARAVQAAGGLLTEEDLAEHRADWVEPIALRYRDVTVYELPPNSQGIIALEMLGILDRLPAERLRAGNGEWVHTIAEAARLAYADRVRSLTDLAHMRENPADWLAPERLQAHAAAIGEHAQAKVQPGNPGGTIYLCTADGEGNLVSLIESNWMGIGSGIMAGESGVMLHNRGHWFSLDPDAANVIAPRKRTMHTLMPGMAFRGNRPWLVFGTMGGSAQAQINVEILSRLIDQHLPLDEAIDAPRFDAVMGPDGNGAGIIQLEGRFTAQTVEDVRRRGHAAQTVADYWSGMGHAHAIEVRENGTYVGAADPRHDSLALGY